MFDNDETKPEPEKFDFSAFPPDTLFHERREKRDRRARADATHDDPSSPRPPAERRAKKERRRRIDPTTFEKQYTEDELEFMNAMQRFKVQTGKSFPTHEDVLKVAFALGYRKRIDCFEDEDDLPEDAEAGVLEDPTPDRSVATRPE
jgi:hypothetical protein